jgi:hypothetical protein
LDTRGGRADHSPPARIRSEVRRAAGAGTRHGLDGRRPRPHRDLPEGIAELRVSTPFRAEHHGFWTGIDGYTDSPDLGTADLGNRSFEAIVGAVAEALVTFTHDAEADRA